MSKRKYKEYTLWLYWTDHGWARAFTIKDEGWPGENPIDVCKEWFEACFHPNSGKGFWDYSKMMILPKLKSPKGYKED